MQAKLFSRQGEFWGREFVIAKEATIGKSQDNVIVLKPEIISKKHARIYFDEDSQCYFVEDLQSKNGTKLDGLLIREKERLGKLHVITFANRFDFFFQLLEGEQAESQEPLADDVQGKTVIGHEFEPVPPFVVEEPPASDLESGKEMKTQIDQSDFVVPKLTSDDQAAKSEVSEPEKTVMGGEFTEMPVISEEESKLEDSTPRSLSDHTKIEEGQIELPELQSEEGKIDTKDQPDEVVKKTVDYLLEFTGMGGNPKLFFLKSGQNSVGRSKSCDICINDSSISRHHAVIIIKGSKIRIKDMDSKNHTFVNNEIIAAEIEVTAGTSIKFGKVEGRLMQKN